MITFNSETHTYTNENGVELISTTQLLSKHHLAPDYSGVDSELLAEKREWGNLIHSEINRYALGDKDNMLSEI